MSNTADRMSPIQHHALCLAAGGYWQLADALELVARNKQDPEITAIAHPPSGPVAVGMEVGTHQEPCEECRGQGVVECDMGHPHSCEERDGEGSTPTAEVRWQTLDGQEVELSRAGQYPWVVSVRQATLLVDEYSRLISRLTGNDGVR